MSTPLNRCLNLMALAIPAAGILTFGTAQPATDMDLKLEGIDGESAGRGYEKHLEVLAWSWGATQSSATGGDGAGKGDVEGIYGYPVSK